MLSNLQTNGSMALLQLADKLDLLKDLQALDEVPERLNLNNPDVDALEIQRLESNFFHYDLPEQYENMTPKIRTCKYRTVHYGELQYTPQLKEWKKTDEEKEGKLLSEQGTYGYEKYEKFLDSMRTEIV